MRDVIGSGIPFGRTLSAQAEETHKHKQQEGQQNAVVWSETWAGAFLWLKWYKLSGKEKDAQNGLKMQNRRGGNRRT